MTITWLKHLLRHGVVQRLALMAGLVMLGAVAFLSLTPSASLPAMSYSDKFYHVIAYLAITASFGIGLPHIRLIWIMALSLLFGIGIEVAQYATALGRSFSLLDVLANLVGTVLAGALVAWLARSPLPVSDG